MIDMKPKSKMTNALISILIITALIIIALQFKIISEPIRDYFADTVDGTETIWINATEYIDIYHWINTTMWDNQTVYVPYWINSTEWINNTEWINTTEIIYVPIWYNNTIWINTTTFINYPFVNGWNVSSPLSSNYVKGYRSGNNYKFDYYNQLTGTLYNTRYVNYATMKSSWAILFNNGHLSNQQFDCGMIQLFILYNS